MARMAESFAQLDFRLCQNTAQAPNPVSIQAINKNSQREN